MQTSPTMHRIVLCGFMAATILAFIVRGSATSITLILSLLALWQLRDPDVRGLAVICWRNYKPWVIALCMLPVLIAVRELFSATPRPSYIDSASRQILAIPLFLLAAQLSFTQLAKIRWAWLIAPVLMLAIALIYGDLKNDPRIHTEFTNTIPFSAFALMFGILLWISSQGLPRTDRVLCWIGIGCSAVIVYLSASRGVWLSVPLAIFFGLKNRPDTSLKKTISIFALLLISAMAAYFISPAVRDRVAISILDFNAFLNGNKDFSSIGMRLQMAIASWHIFSEHPLFGVSRNILPALADLHARHLITDSVSGAVDTHGELFFNIASLGIPGLLATIWFYVGGTLPFWKARQSSDEDLARIGRMGVSCNAVFLITGFTHITLGLAMYASIYAATQAILLAWLFKQQRVVTGKI